MKISPSKEDYLKTIYALKGYEKIVSNKDLAESLDVSAASVTDMNSRLLKEDLITYYPYKGVQLTDLGVKVANQLIRKHRIWEVFLYEKLGFEWNEVHEEADHLEHASSDILIERLDNFLGNPTYDPHGGLIPNADGTVDKEEKPLLPLVKLKPHQYFIVREVPDEDNDLLNYLSEKGFSLNDEYELMAIEPYDGSITIRNTKTDTKITVSGKALEKIKVIQTDDDSFA